MVDKFYQLKFTILDNGDEDEDEDNNKDENENMDLVPTK